jgi:hypothetical protein
MTGASTKPADLAALPVVTRESALPPSRRPGKWRTRWQAFRHPIAGEKTELLRARWASLPPEIRTPNQISGRHLTHCGFTTGASYCSFHCTHCYLPKNANQVPIPSLAQMKEQIDANRRFQGPGGGLQLTGGDVADAYWRSGRQDELVEIVQYAIKAGLVPMLMTHGQTLIEHPEFLEKLMIEGGLRQVAVHIDMTQAGRHGYPIGRIKSEADLHPVRDAFTKLGLGLREKTGLPLEFAHNCTVTARNVDFVPEIVRWALEKPERTYLWRLFSFQPEADTGRTLFSETPATPTLTWQKLCEGTGLPLEREFSIFGHPDCNSWTPLLVSRRSGRFIVFPPQDARTKTLYEELLANVGGVSFVSDDAHTTPFRLLGILFQNPLLILRLLAHVVWLVLTGKIPAELIGALAAGKAHTVGFGIHNFMDAAQVADAPNNPTTQARLDSCVFKGAVKNRRSGEWEAIPMCAMNQQRWSEVYAERLADPALAQEAQATGPLAERDPEPVLEAL